MATISVSCQNCGDVEITSGHIYIEYISYDGTGTYSFLCPSCKLVVTKSASSRIIDLLLASGVDGPKLPHPEPLHPSQANKPPLNRQDEILFASLLDCEDDAVWFQELLNSLE